MGYPTWSAHGDLTITAHRDHRAVLAEMDIVMHERTAPRPKPETMIAKHTLHEPLRIERFQELMEAHNAPDGSVDAQASYFAEYTKRAALESFGSRKDAPRKPWISAGTWRVLREVTPLRRSAFDAARSRTLAYFVVVFTAWAAKCPCD